MKNRNDYAKILSVSFAFLMAFLVISVNAIPLDAQTSSTTATLSKPIQVTPGDPMYKYLNHVPETQYEWVTADYNQDSTRFSPTPNGPETDHLLWVKSLARYAECMNQDSIVVNGKIIVRTNAGKSIYQSATYALDQNTGQLIWSLPSSIGFNKIGGILWGGNTAYDPNTGTPLYTVSPRPSFYDPDLKMAFSNGPTAYSWPDLTQAPTKVWENTDRRYGNIINKIDNGKIFCIDNTGIAFKFTCFDAQTGQVLWDRIAPAANLYISAVSDGKLYGNSYYGFYCFDQNTGETIWTWQGHETRHSECAIANGKVYVYETRTYLHCLDANDGHVIWRYAPVRKIPHWCGASSPGDCNHTMHHCSYYRVSAADGKVYATTMQKTTYGSLLPPNYQGVEYPEGSGIYYWANPNALPAVAHCGENEFVCLDGETGRVIWRVGYGWPYGPNVGTPDAPAYAGPDMGHPVIADSKVYGVEETYSCHTAIGAARPELDPAMRYPESNPKIHLSHNWYTGRVYCFGKGPVLLTLSTNTMNVAAGQPVTISGTAVDVSPASSSTGKLTPAVGLPINLGANGAAIANTVTDKDGKFSVNWTPSTSGTLNIVASSEGNPSYEAPASASVTITVSGGVTLSTVGSIAGIIAITVSAAAITAPIRKRKQEGGTPLE